MFYVMKCSLGVPSVMLGGGSNFLSISGIGAYLGVYGYFWQFLVVYLNKHNIDNDVFVNLSWLLLTHICVDFMLICITYNRD